MKYKSILIVLIVLAQVCSFAETLTFKNGEVIEGAIIQANDNELLLVTASSTNYYAVTNVEQVTASYPQTITFEHPSIGTISNAAVVRVIDGAYVIWRQGASGGKLRLSGLPYNVRVRFGYNETEAALAYAAEEQERQAIVAAQVARSTRSAEVQRAAANALPDWLASQATVESDSSSVYVPSSTSASPAHGGPVHVRGYTKSNGTYVQPHTRRAPRR